jgi:hypothetical protein
MSTTETARAQLDAHNAKRKADIAAIRKTHPHLSEEVIDDVLDALWLQGKDT